MEESGGDGMVSYGSSSRRDDGEMGQKDPQYLRQTVAGIAKLHGSATLVSQSQYDSTLSRINSKFGATSKEAKDTVRQTLTYYFAVHGTSPDTEWASYEYPITVSGRSLPPMEIINEIGLHRLKKFMGRSSALAIEMVSASPEFRSALSERAARANLPPGQEHMAIDFVGKDGSLSRAEMNTRVQSRERLLAHRAHNANNISDMRTDARQASARSEDARAVGTTRPMLSFDS